MKITRPKNVFTNTATPQEHHKLASFVSTLKSFSGLPKAFVKGVSGQDDFTKKVKSEYRK